MKKKKSSWISLYQEKKFLLNHKKKSFDLENKSDIQARESIIAIMLDVQDTIDNIDDEKTKMFMKMLHKLRIKFQAKKVIINLSSHMHTPASLNKYLAILDRNLIPNIFLDDASYFYGTYNFYTGKSHEIDWGYNKRKLNTFTQKYLNEYNVKWFAIIDDTADHEMIKKYQDYKPMIVCRPSKTEADLKYDNFMCYSSLLFGMDGVLGCLNNYLKTVKSIRKEEIVDHQKNMLTHLKAFEVRVLCIKNEYDLLIRYLEEEKLDEEDYDLIEDQMNFKLEKEVSLLELQKINKILELIETHKKKTTKLALERKVNV